MAYNSIEANKAQEEYCKTHDAPHFAPKQRCFNCNQDIYAEAGRIALGRLGRPQFTDKTRAGYSVEEAGSELITDCRFCNASYCE